MTGKAVIDASVALKWVLAEEHTAMAMQLLEDRWDLRAPDIFRAEIANGLYKRVRKNETTWEDANRAYGFVAAMGVVVHEGESHIYERAIKIASAIRHNAVYDCIYLALAEHLNMPSITADHKFIEKMRLHGVAVDILSLVQLH